MTPNQESQANYIKFEYKKACEYLGLAIGEINLRLTGSNTITGNVEVEGKSRSMPKFNIDDGQRKIRVRALNHLLPIADNKWQDSKQDWSFYDSMEAQS